MGQIHQLILSHGIEEARARAKGSDKLHRQCLDAAFAVMSDEEHRVGMTHAGFAMTALPYKAGGFHPTNAGVSRPSLQW